MRRLLPLAILAVLAPLALASHTRVRLERIAPTEDGKLRVYASVVELEGNFDDDRAAPQFTLKVNGKPVGHAERSAPFLASGDPLDIVLIVESSALYGPQIIKEAPAPPPPPVKGGKKGKALKTPKPDKAPKGKAPKTGAPAAPVLSSDQPLDKVKDATKQLLEAIPGKARVLLIDYGGDVTSHAPFRSAASVSDAVDELTADNESGDLVLTNAMRAALLELNKPRPDGTDARKLIVVISDGLNSQMDRKTFRMLGDAAGQAHVPIHTIAFSPTDARGPLLNLGEISKRSHGTFRWARSADDLRTQMETLAEEVNKQYVLTFKVDLAHIEHQRFVLQCEDVESNELVYGTAPAIPSGHLVLWILLGALALAIGGGALIVATRPKKRFATTRGGVAFQPPAAQQPRPSAQQPVYQQPQPQYQQPQPQQPAATRGVIIVVSGGLAGQRLAIDPSAAFTVGKGPAHLQIGDDPTVSTRHAEIGFRGGLWVLTDLNSTNGTYVNNQRVTQPVRLSDGDLVRFGNTQIKFRME